MSTRSVRAGLDYTPAWQQGAGIGRYVRELVAALALEDRSTAWRLFVAGARTAQLPPAPGENFHWRPTPLSPRWLTRIWHRARIPLPVEVFTGPLTLFHAADFALPPVRRSVTTLVQVHDLSFLRVPEAAPPDVGERAAVRGGVSVQEHRDSCGGGDLLAERAGEAHRVHHRGAVERNDRQDIERARPRAALSPRPAPRRSDRGVRRPRSPSPR